MNAQQLREQYMEDRGGIFNPGQQVEVNINGVWMPGQIQEVANFTVRNTETGRNINRPPAQVRPVNGGILDTGENTNIIPGDRVEFQGSRAIYRHPGTLVSKNYVVQIDGRTETVPHTRLRRAPEGQPLPEAPAPQPQGPPPQGPRLPQREYEQNQEIDALVNGEWRPGQIVSIENYTVLNTATGINITIAPENIRGQYRLGTRQRCNLRVYSPVEFRQGNRWFPGTINAINYFVNMVDNRGGLETVSQSNLRPRVGAQPPQPPNQERAEWRANVARWRAELARPALYPAPRPAGVAFEVHNAFDEFKAKKWNKFMEIINRTTGTNTNFRNMRAPLQPLIDYVNSNTSYTPEKKADIIEKINRIFTQIQGYSNYNQNIDNITNCIQYVLMQSPDFIDAYINTFVVDCFKAYTTGDPESCVKGMYERIYLAFRDTVSTLCLDQIQGISAASLCKPDYIEIYDCFYETIPQSLLNDFSKEWYEERGGDEALGSLSPEARIEDFVGFVRMRMNDAARFAKAEASIRRYANKEINVLFGGRRSGRQKRRKTIKKRKNKTIKKRR
jgi:sRNA-binding regulator protein Hfq